MAIRDYADRPIDSDNPKIRAADAIAELTLSDKKDLQGQPLIWHARRVHARLLTMKTGTQGLDLTSVDMQCAALLHDCIEECERPNREGLKLSIGYLLGYNAQNKIETLTRPIAESYKEYIRYIVASNVECIYIKLADLEDNLDPSRGPIPDSLKSRYEWARHTLRSAVGLE